MNDFYVQRGSDFEGVISEDKEAPLSRQTARNACFWRIPTPCSDRSRGGLAMPRTSPLYAKIRNWLTFLGNKQESGSPSPVLVICSGPARVGIPQNACDLFEKLAPRNYFLIFWESLHFRMFERQKNLEIPGGEFIASLNFPENLPSVRCGPADLPRREKSEGDLIPRRPYEIRESKILLEPWISLNLRDTL